MQVLASEMAHLKATLEHPVYGLSALAVKIEAVERNSNSSCKDCNTWSRIAELEKQVERSKGMAVGISSVIGLAWGVVTFFLTHGK